MGGDYTSVCTRTTQETKLGGCNTGVSFRLSAHPPHPYIFPVSLPLLKCSLSLSDRITSSEYMGEAN
jgi:hypothetical protein